MTRAAGRLWVIDPSLNVAEDQGVEELLVGWAGESRLFRPVLDGNGPSAADGYDFDALVLLGSAASVYDSHAWLTQLRDWLRPIVSGEVERPLLGICFGHQLIAEIAGARVSFLGAPADAKRLGIEETQFRSSRLIDDGLLRVVVSHRETVSDRPDGFRVTASRPGVEIDGLEHEQFPVFSYQFHPEAREEFAARSGIALHEIDERLRQDSRLVIDSFYRQIGRQ